MVGYEMAHEIRQSSEDGRQLMLILPRASSIFKWVGYFLKQCHFLKTLAGPLGENCVLQKPGT